MRWYTGGCLVDTIASVLWFRAHVRARVCGKGQGGGGGICAIIEIYF